MNTINMDKKKLNYYNELNNQITQVKLLYICQTNHITRIFNTINNYKSI
jgi:hypothetical protein